MKARYHSKVLGSMLAMALTMSVYAQLPSDNLSIADKYYSSGDYFSAIQYYEKYLTSLSGKKKDGFDPYSIQPLLKKSGLTEDRKLEVINRIADSYVSLNYPQKAEPYYEQIVNGSNNVSPQSRYKYAATLRALKKYDQAEKEVSTLLNGYHQKDELYTAANNELESLKFIKNELAKADLDLYTIKKDALNGAEANYAPVIINNSELLLTSTRSDAKSKGTKNKLYTTTITESNTSGTVSEVEIPFNIEHIGAASVSKDGRNIYFTAWQVTNGAKLPMIYKAQKEGSGWSKPTALNANVNAVGVKNQQPFITEDGKTLFFVSNRKGSKGGLDIWYISLDVNGEPVGEAKNAGNIINTIADEQAPYYHASSNTLVFASNGRVGMGGYDLYYTKGNIQSGWNAVENFGYPVNSVKDDIYFASKATGDNILESVWLSSDRDAACCLELYSVVKKAPAPIAKVEAPKVEVPEPIIEKGIAKVLDNVYFEYDKYILLDASHESLNEVVALMKANPSINAEIGGHTDNKGKDSYNERLSQQRAQACVDYIVSQGIDASRLTAKGYGSSKPIAPNTLPNGKDNPEGRAKNRRTEFTILDK